MSAVLDNFVARIRKQKADGKIPGSILGTGFLVVYPWLATCNHVLVEAFKNKKATDCLEAGELEGIVIDFPVHSGFSQQLFRGQLHTSKPKLELATLNDIEDIALVKLEPFNKSDSIDCYLSWMVPIKYEQSLDEYVEKSFLTKGFHIDKCDELKGKTQTITTDGRISLPFDDAESIKGASGSPVWCDEAQAIFGMLVSQRGEGAETYKNRRVYMIPMYKIMDACEDLKNTYLEKKRELSNFQIHRNDSFQDDILVELETVFTNSDLLFKGFLKKHRLADELDPNLLVGELKREAQNGLNKIVRNLTIVLRDELEKLENKEDYKTANSLINDAEKAIQRISLLAIHKAEAEALTSSVLYSSSTLNLSLSQQTLGSAETVTAIRMQSLPKYVVSKNRPEVKGKYAFSNFDLEPGIKQESIVDYVCKQFWRIVFPSYSVDAYDEQRLRDQVYAELSADDLKKKNYYLVILINPNCASPLADSEVKQALNKRLPELPIIVLNNATESAVYLSEDRALMAEIYNFYSEVHNYEQRTKQTAPTENKR